MRIFYILCLFFISSAAAMQVPNNAKKNENNRKNNKVQIPQKRNCSLNPSVLSAEQIQRNYATIWAYPDYPYCPNKAVIDQ